MTAPRKPKDVGNGLVCASFGAGGEWLSLATVHPQVGFVELTGLPLFAPEWRGDAVATRRYRSWMRREEHAFLHVEAGRATVTTRQDAPKGTRVPLPFIPSVRSLFEAQRMGSGGTARRNCEVFIGRDAKSQAWFIVKGGQHGVSAMATGLDIAMHTHVTITHRGKRYFINNRYRLSQRLWEFLFSPLMAQVAEATVGPDAYLFHEQWVVKGAEQGMKFAWHQDSGYVKWYEPSADHKPYVTCWCTLDDVSEANGTVYILPHSRAGTKDKIIDHFNEHFSAG